MFRILFLQSFEHDVDGIFKVLIVLTYLHGIQHLQKRIEVLFLLRRLKMDIADQRRIKQGLRLRPEFIAGFSLSFRIRNESSNQLQNVLFAVNILERVIFHGFLHVYYVQHPHEIVIADQG